MWEPSCRYNPACNGLGEGSGYHFSIWKVICDYQAINFLHLMPFQGIFMYVRKRISQRLLRSNGRILTKGHTVRLCQVKSRPSAKLGICQLVKVVLLRGETHNSNSRHLRAPSGTRHRGMVQPSASELPFLSGACQLGLGVVIKCLPGNQVNFTACCSVQGITCVAKVSGTPRVTKYHRAVIWNITQSSNTEFLHPVSAGLL